MQAGEDNPEGWRIPSTDRRGLPMGWSEEELASGVAPGVDRHASDLDVDALVDWDSFSLLDGRRLRWRGFGPLLQSSRLVDHQTGAVVASLFFWRTVVAGFIAGNESYGVESDDNGYRLVDDRTEVSIICVQGQHSLNRAETRADLPDGTSVTFPVTGRSRRRAVLHAVTSDGAILFHLRWRWGSLWAGVAGLEVAVAPGQELTAESLGLIYLSSTSLLANYFVPSQWHSSTG